MVKPILALLCLTLFLSACAPAVMPATAMPTIAVVEPTATEMPVEAAPIVIHAPIENEEIDNDIAELRGLSTPTKEQSDRLLTILATRVKLETQANALPGWKEVLAGDMQFAIVNAYDAENNLAGGFALVKNIVTSEQMVLSVIEKIEADGTVTRKDINLPLFERFEINAQGRFVNGDWYYVDAEGKEHVLYKTNGEGKLGGVPLAGGIVWSETVFGFEYPDATGKMAKLAKLIPLAPEELAGMKVDTRVGTITDVGGVVRWELSEAGEWVEVVWPKVTVLESTTASWDWVWNDGGGVAMKDKRTFVEWGSEQAGVGAYQFQYSNAAGYGSWLITIDNYKHSVWWLGHALEEEKRSDGTTEYYLDSLVYQGPTSKNLEPFLYHLRLPLSELYLKRTGVLKQDGFVGQEEARRAYEVLLNEDGNLRELLTVRFVVAGVCTGDGPVKACQRLLTERNGQPFAPGTAELTAYFSKLWEETRDGAGVVGDEAIKEFLASGEDWQNSLLVPLLDPDRLAVWLSSN